jgi:RNA polymerase sigma-70 factor (ECF subfamily)
LPSQRIISPASPVATVGNAEYNTPIPNVDPVIFMNDLRFTGFISAPFAFSFWLSQRRTPGTGVYSSKRAGKIAETFENKLWNKIVPRRFTLVCVSADAQQRGTFEELAMPLFNQLYNFAHWLAQNRDEAEDLVQETYVKALRGFATFQQGTNFRAWMYRILRNTFLTSRTGHKATMTVPLNEDEDGPVVEAATDTQTPETILIDRDHQDLLQSALEELPLHFREIVLLCDVEEMSYQEMAELLGIPIGTVMSRLSRGRAALRSGVQQKLQRAG